MLLNAALPVTWKRPSPRAVTVGATTPPRFPVKVWRLPPWVAPPVLPVLPVFWFWLLFPLLLFWLLLLPVLPVAGYWRRRKKQRKISSAKRFWYTNCLQDGTHSVRLGSNTTNSASLVVKCLNSSKVRAKSEGCVEGISLSSRSLRGGRGSSTSGLAGSLGSGISGAAIGQLVTDEL